MFARSRGPAYERRHSPSSDVEDGEVYIPHLVTQAEGQHHVTADRGAASQAQAFVGVNAVSAGNGTVSFPV